MPIWVPNWAVTELVFTMEPERWRFMYRATCLQKLKVPPALTSMTRSKTLLSVRVMGESTVMPATLSMMSMRPPKRSATASTTPMTDSSLRTSHWKASKRVPYFPAASARPAMLPVLMSTPATMAPSAINVRAHSWPMPEFAPVIMATLSFSSIAYGL